jgi:signal transduction histidine kinase
MLLAPSTVHAAQQPASRILFVDDNAENRALIESALDDEGYQVISAESGEEGVRAFEAHAPDCVLLDVRMPGMDGFATCTRLRQLPGGPETPIVFLTALRDVETFDRALSVGADDFLTKPVQPAELAVRVQAALKLRKMSAEIRQHYELIRRQRDDLMRLQLQKERLTAFIVHDLKNPVNAMDLHAQVLLRNRELPGSARESVLHIREGARTLLRLVLNLLDISKSEEGKLVPHPERVELAALVTQVFDALELRARDASVTLEHSVETAVLSTDPDLLRRVIENLLDNAIRHAPQDSKVSLTCRASDGAVEVRVTDAGPGVPSELREKIFEPFVQLENGERVVTRAGRGLGLTFCKLAVEALGGELWVEDASPGAAFCIRLRHE